MACFQLGLYVVICFQISIFEPLKTTIPSRRRSSAELWFAFKLVSLNHWKQRTDRGGTPSGVVICFQISIFEPLKTTVSPQRYTLSLLWFAFKLVSLNHWKQRRWCQCFEPGVVICFQISIFEPLKTTECILQANYQSVTHIFRN